MLRWLRHPVTKQIGREFWLPALIATAWTIATWTSEPAGNKPPYMKLLGSWGATLGLIAWTTGQIVRITKQQRTEGSFKSLEDRVSGVIDRLEKQAEKMSENFKVVGDQASQIIENLEKQAKDFAGNIMGQGGHALLSPTVFGPPTVQFMLINDSPYPVFDTRVEVIDLDEPDVDIPNGRLWTRHTQIIERLDASRGVELSFRVDVSKRELTRINVFIHSRAYHAVQEFRMRMMNNWPQIAFATQLNGEEHKYNVPQDFPEYDPTNPRALFIGK